MQALLTYLEWFLGKWHQNGLHSITREDYAELEKLYLEARMHGNELEWAIEEFSEAMDSPRSDAADQRRLAALALLRKKKNDILLNREAASVRIQRP